MPTTALAVAGLCRDFATTYVVDTVDEADVPAILDLGIAPLVCSTLMRAEADKIQLAPAVLATSHG